MLFRADKWNMEIGPLHKDAQSAPVAPAPPPVEIAAQNRELIQAVKLVNAAQHLGLDQELTFVLDRRTRRPLVRLVNRRTGEIIRQVLPEYVLELAKLLSA